MNDFLSSIWIYFFSFCLSFQLNCSSHLLRRSGRSPPNLALKRMVFREGCQWTTLPLGISLVGKTHEIGVVHQHIISERRGAVEVRMRVRCLQHPSTRKGARKCPRIKGNHWTLHFVNASPETPRLLAQRDIILGYRLAFCVQGVTPKSSKPSKLTHFTLKHFQASCF